MSQVAVELVDGRIQINAGWMNKDAIKSIPGARWNSATSAATGDVSPGGWSVLCSWAACKQLRTTFGERLEIGEALLKWATSEVESRVAPSMALRQALDASPEGLDPRLFPFQRAGVRFLVAAQNALLSDPCGAGKTIQAIAAARALGLGEQPKLVICPNSMVLTWAREIAIWDPDATTHVVKGSATQRNKILEQAAFTPGWAVINWEAVRRHSRLAPYGSIALTDKDKERKHLNMIDWALVICDEAHRLASPKTQQTRAVFAIAAEAEYRWALTGTPLTAAPDTLWSILHFLDKEEWPARSSFIERYCAFSFNVFGGLEVFGIKPNMDEEFQSIFQPRFRRMPKEVILPQLPPIVRVRRDVEMAPKQAKAYKAMAEHMCARLEDGEGLVIAQNPIARLTRLTQFSSSYAEVVENEVKLADPSAKLDQLMIDLEDYLGEGESVVIFAQSRQLIEMAAARLEKAGVGCSVVKGGQTQDQRQREIDAYQSKQVPVILVVILAGGTGLTLTAGRIAIFLQRSWSKVDQIQAEGRVHRIGSEIHESIMIVDYIATGTVEEHQLEVLEMKEGQLEEVVKDKDAIRRLLYGE